jgi:hypothetical protein
MKLHLLILFALVATIFPLWSQQPSNDRTDVATTWPEVHYRIAQVLRLEGDHVVVVVNLYATAKAPLGTFIGIPVPIPPNASPEEIQGGMFRPNPFSIQPAVLTDELSKQTFSTLPVAPLGPGTHYLPPTFLGTLHPQQSDIMTIQFSVPPPPPPEGGGLPPEQKVSILLPNAMGPVKDLIIPPKAPGPVPPQ